MYKIFFALASFSPFWATGQVFDTAYSRGDILPGTHPRLITWTGDGVFTRIIDSFDEEGKMIEKKQFFSKGSGRRTIYRYNAKGRLARREVTNIGDRSKYCRFEYIYPGNKIVMKEFSLDIQPGAKLMYTTTGTYNKSNSLDRADITLPDDTNTYTTRYYYDSNGRVNREERNYLDLPDGTTKGKITQMGYDNQGRIVDEFYPGDDQYPTVSFMYTYLEVDDKGNWTKKNQHTKLVDIQQSEHLTARKIEYY